MCERGGWAALGQPGFPLPSAQQVDLPRGIAFLLPGILLHGGRFPAGLPLFFRHLTFLVLKPPNEIRISF